MTTQELKEYIGRVLGNGIRCLLPSYWWKRLFGLVVDKVEEVEGSIVSSLDEFAKERPDIEMRTFYVSEDAELVAHNVQVFQTLMRDSAKKKIGPYYIATTIDEDQQVWWIRNDSFYPTGVGAMPTFIIEEDSKKYVVIFFMDGAYIKQETEDDPSNDKVDEERIFYHTTGAETEAAQKNLALYEKIVKESSNTIIKPVYIAYYMYNLLPTTVAQWGTLGVEASAGELIRFYDIFTSSIDSKYKIDLVLMTDGTLEVREPYFSVRGDLELKKNAKTPIANSVATKELYKSARAIMIKGALDTEEMHADNAKIHYSIRNGEYYRPIIITDYSTTYLVTHRELTGGVEDPIRFVGITYNYKYGEYDLRYIQILLNADGTVTEEKGGSLEGNAEVPDISGLATKEELDTKQDKITDLETIRSGAAKGATALQSVKTINGTSILGSGDIVINGGGEIDTELSETSENAIANRVVTAEFNNIKEKIEGIENIVADNKVLLYLTIEGEPNNTLFEDVKATITYGDTTVVAGNETVILPTFTEVTITFPSIDGYNKPQDIVFTTGWSDTIYKTGVYSTLIPSYISIDQTITDPALMITGDVNGYEIQKIRNNSHRYLGKYTAEGTMTLCQLDDSDSTKYADGSAADLTGAEGDVFVKLPRFWYKAEEIQSDVWRIGFMCGNIAPSSEWKEWDGNDLIGAYEAYVESSKVYSRSGVSSSADIAPSTYIANGASRGKGFSLVKWHHHNMMAFLFYAMYGNTNCQAIVGSGTSVDSKPTGQTDLLGMEDTSANTNGNSQSINFWGLENWWGNKFEIVDNITYASKTYYITEDDGVIRNVYSGLSNGSTWPKKLKIGEYLDCVPTLGGGSATTGYCDTCSPTDSGSTIYYLRRSYPREITGCGVVAFNTASSATSNGGSRLAFKGSIIEETNVNRFKLMEAIA